MHHSSFRRMCKLLNFTHNRYIDKHTIKIFNNKWNNNIKCSHLHDIASGSWADVIYQLSTCKVLCTHAEAITQLLSLSRLVTRQTVASLLEWWLSDKVHGMNVLTSKRVTEPPSTRLHRWGAGLSHGAIVEARDGAMAPSLKCRVGATAPLLKCQTEPWRQRWSARWSHGASVEARQCCLGSTYSHFLMGRLPWPRNLTNEYAAPYSMQWLNIKTVTTTHQSMPWFIVQKHYSLSIQIVEDCKSQAFCHVAVTPVVKSPP